MMGLTEGREFLVEPSPLDKSKLQAELQTASNVSNNNNNDDHRLSPIKYNLRLAQAKTEALAEAHSRNTTATTTGTRTDNGNG
eukprot:CAMPEP_0168219496 /NCGR_PEP_ID=MMETSP0140_2-20121125/8609_1 /TAXON_ID=44445 /ORGANISM="Pseudo-nitzschia australis, Strain 10249 10 AB" /LENGTH=82 /DNA_ID=CAMNT_0008147917 /DNA_START=48 /DNA_END=293 /DNA_ORIENTATION=+